jgi:hypothetical protein
VIAITLSPDGDPRALRVVPKNRDQPGQDVHDSDREDDEYLAALDGLLKEFFQARNLTSHYCSQRRRVSDMTYGTDPEG